MAKAQPKISIFNDPSIALPPHVKVGFRPVRCAEHHFKVGHFPGEVPCECPQNPQITALVTPADEIGLGGTRGSAKTEVLLAFMAFKGNPYRTAELHAQGKTVTGADIAYINHKDYRGLILRNQANDLGDLLDRAEAMYGPTGAEITRGNPAIAKWKTGAAIIFGHFGDQGWKKYIGPQYQRMGIDQAEMMASKEIHDRIVGSCRSKWSDLIPQVMLTFNPGGGDEEDGAPGQAWLMEYFRIEAYLSGKVPKDMMVRDEHGKLRLFIPSSYKDNPYLAHHFEFDAEGRVSVLMSGEGKYEKWLNSIEPESLRRAWRDADWGALSGTYFKDFRPNGPLIGEPANARHVYDPSTVRMEPWFHRWVSIDWGYIHPTAIQWHCKAPWGQIYTYREVCISRVEPVELGVLIARESRADLAGIEAHHMNVFLSPDAYAKRESENTIASQIAVGISRELGPGSAFVSDLTETERLMQDSEQALQSMQQRRREQTKTMLTLVRANTDRVAGWMHMQTLLRFRPLSKVIDPDKEFANRLYEEKGLVAYQQYMNQPEFKANAEVLPKWQISSECRELIRCLPTLMHKPGTNDVQKRDATETMAGDDSCDCARYGLLSEERQGKTLAPLHVRVSDRVESFRKDMPGLSNQSIEMMHRVAIAKERDANKRNEPFPGRNRLAQRRAFLATKHGTRERTIA